MLFHQPSDENRQSTSMHAILASPSIPCDWNPLKIFKIRHGRSVSRRKLLTVLNWASYSLKSENLSKPAIRSRKSATWRKWIHMKSISRFLIYINSTCRYYIIFPHRVDKIELESWFLRYGKTLEILLTLVILVFFIFYFLQ